MTTLPAQATLPPALYQVLLNSIEARDAYTAGHSQRVATRAAQLASVLALPPLDIAAIERAGWLHDIGKIGTPDRILNKRGPLTSGERRCIECHPRNGVAIIAPMFPELAPAILHHHERWDGTGYPQRLTGEQIPLHARILAVSDAWDALLTDRSYRKGRSPHQAAQILLEGAGTQWDPALITAWLQFQFPHWTWAD